MAVGISKVCSVMTITAAGLPPRQPCGGEQRKKRSTAGKQKPMGKAKRVGSPVTSPTGCGMRRQPYGLRGCAAEWRSGCAAEWRRRAKRRKNAARESACSRAEVAMRTYAVSDQKINTCCRSASLLALRQQVFFFFRFSFFSAPFFPGG